MTDAFDARKQLVTAVARAMFVERHPEADWANEVADVTKQGMVRQAEAAINCVIGSPPTPCPECVATGCGPCPACRGDGDFGECRECRGFGQVDYKECATCEGHGVLPGIPAYRTPCARCGGAKMLPADRPRMADDIDAGPIPCPNCPQLDAVDVARGMEQGWTYYFQHDDTRLDEGWCGTVLRRRHATDNTP